ncbi:GPP34 family phosphoprotein [Pseudonocardia sp. KRD291]|uniref:GOLPH3/VPS74 family protein n=1 Tax=Pseudonocardia sp. KRD291 TaxID=2792007 RepID=UPI001C49E597|nr:GPP34 family phosphoprotein [Pseudonocardia sp. KRD291]MBW0104982.1 GPP34 family phosphoprotein [Pseudonocardia sp. KRD291]
MERGRMAPGFFLIVHDPLSGKARIAPDLLRCGVVGTQVADLVIGGRLTLADDRLVVTRHDTFGLDEPARYVLDCVAHEPDGYTVRAWSGVLGEILVEMVARRLTADSVLRRESGRGRLGRRRDRHPAVDLARARQPGADLAAMLREPHTFTLPGAFTAALLQTLGIDDVLEPDVDRARLTSLATQAVGHLPGSLAALRSGLVETASATTTPSGQR